MTENESSRLIRVGTRGSMLAVTQTKWVVQQIARHHPELQFELQVIRTSGDESSAPSITPLAGKGLFTREIEDALRRGEIDLAVHSLKDLPTEWPAGLGLGAVPIREDPRDALIGLSLEALTKPSLKGPWTIGTSSLRRGAQLRAHLPQCRIVPFRGNIDTRLRKVAENQVDAAVLAVAGLRRLEQTAAITRILPPEICLPAPAQGALAVEIRLDDRDMMNRLASIHCRETAACVTAERAFMNALGGGCHVPVAALAEIQGNLLLLRGRVIAIAGQPLLDGRNSGPIEAAEELGKTLAADLISRGAGDILQAAHETPGAPK